MSPVQLFDLANLLALVFWLPLLALPRWRGTQWLATRYAGVLVVAVLYAWQVVPMLVQTLPLVANPKFEVLHPLLSTPEAFAVVWLHIVAFDLLAGTWMYNDSRSRKLNPWAMVPFLLLALMAGPLGWGLYRSLRQWLPTDRA